MTKVTSTLWSEVESTASIKRKNTFSLYHVWIIYSLFYDSDLIMYFLRILEDVSAYDIVPWPLSYFGLCAVQTET